MTDRNLPRRVFDGYIGYLDKDGNEITSMSRQKIRWIYKGGQWTGGVPDLKIPDEAYVPPHFGVWTKENGGQLVESFPIELKHQPWGGPNEPITIHTTLQYTIA